VFLNRDFDTWDSFKEFFRDYFGLPQQRRDQFLFRGLPDSNWTLKSTLDLCRTFPSDQEHSAAVTQLLREFRRESIRTGIAFSQLPDDIGLELLARHHGLPSPLIDWTDSPFIAAFFAFEASIQTHAERVVVYLLDRARWPETEVPITIVDDINTVRFNRRALQQRGAFLRVGTRPRRWSNCSTRPSDVRRSPPAIAHARWTNWKR
jgi:hypothetical protein